MLAASEETIARDGGLPRRKAAGGVRRARREFEADLVPEAEGGYTVGRKRTGVRLTFHGGLPESAWGRVFTGVALLAMAGLVFAGLTLAERLMLRDQRFVITTPEAVAVNGIRHVTRAQAIGALDAVVGRNIFSIPLEQERSRLEALPWVKQATVMRLLPDHLRATVVERTPVAFARNAGHIDLVDAAGVLLNVGSSEDQRNSFPVVTGISPRDPLSMRASRMHIFSEFMSALDATGEHVSAKLSEVDLSNPEDVKALIPEGGTDVLVHFGDAEYLERYHRFERLLPEWRTQYPKLASVDMRYERQVVLEMQGGAQGATAPVPSKAAVPASVVKPSSKPEVTTHGWPAKRSFVHASTGRARHAQATTR